MTSAVLFVKNLPRSALFCILALALVVPVAAVDIDEVMRLKESGAIMSLEDLLEQVRHEYPGRIIEIELEKENGKYVYEIDLVDENGIVWELELDAETGDLLKLKRDD